MTTDAETAHEILGRVQHVADARMRAMMGGCLVHVDEVLVGQINDDALFVKESPFATEFAPELERRPPYPGAKPAVVVPTALQQEQGWFRQLLVGSVTALRKPAKRPRA